MSSRCLYDMDSKPPRPSDNRPPRPSDNRPPKPSDMKSKTGKGPMFKDRREHRIELRKKTTALKEEINELKAIETTDEAKQAEIQEAISELRIRLKQCEMEKDAIENFNHTQFLNNVKASDQNTDRYSDEKTGNTRFFEHLKGSTSSKTEDSESKESDSKGGDPFLQANQGDDAPKNDPLLESSESSSDDESSETSETKSPPPPVQLPPNTIV